jgi:hypothetical protein
MSQHLDEPSDADRLGGMKAQLSRHFGKLTRWRALCQERDVTTDDEKIRLAEEVLAAPSTGTVAEWLTHHLHLKGGKSFDVDEMLLGGGSSSRNEAS